MKFYNHKQLTNVCFKTIVQRYYNLLFHNDLFAIDDVQPLNGFCNLTSL